MLPTVATAFGAFPLFNWNGGGCRLSRRGCRPVPGRTCAGETRFEDGERVWIACDLGDERSDSAVVWVNEQLHVDVLTWGAATPRC